MKDLIERLLITANKAATLQEAADELQRLTAKNNELERLHAAVTIQVTQRQHEIDKLIAERDAAPTAPAQQEFIATATHSTSSGRIEFTGTEALTELLGRFGSGRLVHLYAADTLERLSRDKMNLAADIVEVATLRDKLLRDRDEKIERLSQLFEQERNVSDTQALLIERLTTERDALKADAEDEFNRGIEDCMSRLYEMHRTATERHNLYHHAALELAKLRSNHD